MPLILGTNSIKDTGYEVANSCRFNKADTPSLSITPGSNGSNTVWTISMWCKRITLSDGSNDQKIHAAGTSSTYELLFSTADQLTLYNGSTTVFVTNRKFRDVSAWYHIVVAYNTGASGNDRCKVYINGTQETSFATDNRDDGSAMNHINQSVAQFVGNNNAGDGFDGYIAEVCVIDGTAYAASSFGEFNEDSPQIWQPIDVSELTFGTNGAYFDFESSGNLGNDANGGTDWAENNIAAADQAVDSPTNNFCVMNPLDNYFAGATFAEGSCKVTTLTSEGEAYNTGTIGVANGMWYFEAKLTSASGAGSANDGFVGATGRMAIAAGELGDAADNYGYSGSGGGIRNNNSTTTSGYDTYTTGDIIGVYIDCDNNKIYWAKNGTIQDSGTGFALSTSPDTGFYFPAVGDWATNLSQVWDFNFGGCSAFTVSSGNADANGYGNFEYDPSSGTFDSASKDFLAICTKNLGSDGG